jgi:predicted Holliday junction resolvase-like endonuclease
MTEDDSLTRLAYDDLQERIVRNLEGELHQLDRILEKADPALKKVWQRMRERSVPDQAAKRDATLKLLEQVRRLQYPAGWGE